MRSLAAALVLTASVAFAQDETHVDLFVGVQKTIPVPGIISIAIQNSTVANGKFVTDQLIFVGVTPGKTIAAVRTLKGERFNYTITVKPKPPKKKVTALFVSVLEVKAGTSLKLTVDGLEKASSPDDKVAEVSIEGNVLTVNAKAAGEVTLELTVHDGPSAMVVKSVP